MKDEMRYEEDLEMVKKTHFSLRGLNRMKDLIPNETRRLENVKMKLERKRAWLEK